VTAGDDEQQATRRWAEEAEAVPCQHVARRPRACQRVARRPKAARGTAGEGATAHAGPARIRRRLLGRARGDGTGARGGGCGDGGSTDSSVADICRYAMFYNLLHSSKQ